LRLAFLLFFSVALLNAAAIKQSRDSGYVTTQDGAKAFCRQKPGWRLPKIDELFSLISDNSRLLKHKSGVYWSTTNFISDSSMAWQVSYPDKEVKPARKYTQANVLCIKNTPYQEDLRSRFEFTDKTVFDTKESLHWQQLDKRESYKRYSYAQAKNYCEYLKLDDRKWRLPTTDELFSILEFDRTGYAIDRDFFKYTYPVFYWASDSSDEAHVAGFKAGIIEKEDKDKINFVICVSEQNDQIASY